MKEKIIVTSEEEKNEGLAAQEIQDQLGLSLAEYAGLIPTRW